MKFISFVNTYKVVADPETGEFYQELDKADCTLPMDISLGEILTVAPQMTRSGKLYKHVSKLTDRYGNTYKVLGNYKEIIKMKEEGEPTNKIGY